MERPRKLSASFVKTVRRPGRYGDGRGGYGLSLLVKPTSTGRISRTWAQRLYINGKAVNLALGAYPLVTLKEARANLHGDVSGHVGASVPGRGYLVRPRKPKADHRRSRMDLRARHDRGGRDDRRAGRCGSHEEGRLHPPEGAGAGGATRR